MAYSYNINEGLTVDKPTVERDVQRTIMFLQKHNLVADVSLYDHLTDLLRKIIETRPRNAYDVFEDFSRKLKEEKFKSQKDYLRSKVVKPENTTEANEFIELFKAIEYSHTDKKEIIPDVFNLFSYFEQVDVTLPKSELTLLNLSIAAFIKTNSHVVENVRFWGKIFGLNNDYYILEADLTSEELSYRINMQSNNWGADNWNSPVNRSSRWDADRTVSSQWSDWDQSGKAVEKEKNKIVATENHNISTKSDKISQKEDKIEIPLEEMGTGVNRKVYYVCNDSNVSDWTELPCVTPNEISISRKIIRFFTGDLKAEITNTYPPFPGNEGNYLRAQIARISASTHVSPIGFYTIEGMDNVENIPEIMDTDGKLLKNVDYVPPSMEELVKHWSLNWCHHVPYILEQGRVVFWNSKPENGTTNDKDEGEAGNQDEEPLDIEREIEPPLLSPLSEDAQICSTPAWSARRSFKTSPTGPVALLRSNLWQGAYAFASGKTYGNVYIGWGHKYTPYNYSPPLMPEVEEQFEEGSELLENNDPMIEKEEESSTKTSEKEEDTDEESTGDED